MATLRAMEKDRRPALSRTMGGRGGAAFAEDLCRIAHAADCALLTGCAETLRLQAATFQISLMDSTLVQFPDLLVYPGEKPDLPLSPNPPRF